MTFRLEAMTEVKGCKKATRYEDPKGKRDGGLSGISTLRQPHDPLLFGKGQAGWIHIGFGKLFLADAGSSAFWSDSSPQQGSLQRCTATSGCPKIRPCGL